MIGLQLASICAHQGIENPKLNERIKIVALGILCFLDGGGLQHMLNPELEYLDDVWKLQMAMWVDYLAGK